MFRILWRILFIASLTLSAFNVAVAQSLNTMDDVGAAINKCWTPPDTPDVAFVTVRFSFKRDGSLIGPPMATAINVPGDEAVREDYVKQAIAAVEKCTPLSFSPELSEGIAGQVFSMRFGSEN